MNEVDPTGQELGELFIEEHALEMIVYGALLEVEGLFTPDRVKGGGLWTSLSRAQQGDGIQIDLAPDEISGTDDEADDEDETVAGEPGKRLKLRLSLVAKYGTPIHKSAERAIQTVKRKLEELAGAEVDEVHVDIVGLTADY